MNTDKGPRPSSPTGRAPTGSKHSSGGAKPPRESSLSLVWRFREFVFPHWRLGAGSLLAGLLRAAALLAFPLAMKHVIDGALAPPPGSAAESLSASERTTVLAWLLGPLPLLFLLAFGATFLRSMWSGKLSLRIIVDLRQKLYERVLGLGLRYHENRRAGEIVSRLMDDANLAQQFVTDALSTIWIDGASLLFILGALFWLDWKLALLSLLFLPPVALQTRFFLRRVRDSSREQQERRAQVSANLHEKVAGHQLVASHAAERREGRLSFRLLRLFFHSRMENMKWRALFGSTLMFLTQCAPLAIFAYGAWRIIGDQAAGAADPMTLGKLTAFGSYLGELLGPVNRFADLNVSVSNSLAGLERVYEVLDEEPDVVESAKPSPVPAPFLGHIRFEAISFRYRDDRPEAVRDIDLELLPGQTVALVGESGGGKSTIAKLLPRFYDPQAGRVVVDGVDVRDWSLAELRSRVGFVSQEVLVFSETIRENILYGRAARRGAAAPSEEELIAAARAAGAWDFIRELPKGFDTEIGERGVRLSAGQRQRIAIARLFLKNPPILVLDEATSALDSATEQAVQESLDTLMAGRTTLAIAHRLSTIRRADLIAVVVAGRIVERGTHAELLAQGGVYADLWRRQSGEPDLAAASSATSPG